MTREQASAFVTALEQQARELYKLTACRTRIEVDVHPSVLLDIAYLLDRRFEQKSTHIRLQVGEYVTLVATDETRRWPIGESISWRGK